MEKSSLPTLREFLEKDLDYICANLQSEFGRLSGKRLLITGGAGFLGYYLALSVLHYNRRAAAADTINLTIWDNFMRGMPRWLDEVRGTAHISVEKRDLTMPLPAPMGDYQWIIHAAGIASPTYYRKYPLQTIDSNITGLRNLLEYCVQQRDARHPVEGLMFYSSSEIYGDPAPEWIPTPERYRGNVSCTGPRACYDESKRFGETLCVVYSQEHGIPVKIARPFNNYGPGLKITDRRVIPDFVRDVFSGRDIVMYSDGKPTRTFCYSADSIVGYYKVLVNGQGGEPYNIGIDRPEISMNELAEKIISTAGELFGYRGRLVHGASTEPAYLVDNPNRRCPDLKKSRSQLRYSPSILVDDGIYRSLIWYHHNREAEEA